MGFRSFLVYVVFPTNFLARGSSFSNSSLVIWDSPLYQIPSFHFSPKNSMVVFGRYVFSQLIFTPNALSLHHSWTIFPPSLMFISPSSAYIIIPGISCILASSSPYIDNIGLQLLPWVNPSFFHTGPP